MELSKYVEWIVCIWGNFFLADIILKRNNIWNHHVQSFCDFFIYFKYNFVIMCDRTKFIKKCIIFQCSDIVVKKIFDSKLYLKNGKIF